MLLPPRRMGIKLIRAGQFTRFAGNSSPVVPKLHPCWGWHLSFEQVETVVVEHLDRVLNGHWRCHAKTRRCWSTTFLALGRTAFNSVIVQPSFGHVPSLNSKNKTCGADSSVSVPLRSSWQPPRDRPSPAGILLILALDSLCLGDLRDLVLLSAT